MTAFFIILASLVATGAVLYLLHLRDLRCGDGPEIVGEPMRDPGGEAADRGEVCCGRHAVCEKELEAFANGEPVLYFDDEELDRFAGRERGRGRERGKGNDCPLYTPEEVEEIRGVMLTLLPEDIAPWERSLQRRGIALPPELRDELVMLAADADAGNKPAH